MWVVHVGDDVYVCSPDGPDRAWHRRAVSSGAGRVRAGGVKHDVTFGDAGSDVHVAIDSAHHAKYGQNVVGNVVSSKAQRSRASRLSKFAIKYNPCHTCNVCREVFCNS